MIPKEDKIADKNTLKEDILTSEDFDNQAQVDIGPDFPTSINEDLQKLVDDNPNKLIGCGG